MKIVLLHAYWTEESQIHGLVIFCWIGYLISALLLLYMDNLVILSQSHEVQVPNAMDFLLYLLVV